MARQITGQSISTEPKILGLKGLNPSRLDSQLKATNTKPKSRINTTLQKEKGGNIPKVARKKKKAPVKSTNIMSKPLLVSGRASKTDGGISRRKEVLEGKEIMVANTIRNYSDIPQV